MNTEPLGELIDFHRFVGEHVRKGEGSLSPEQVLDEWRTLHPDPNMTDDDLEWTEDDYDAIQVAIDDMENGDVGIPLEEFDRDFRTRHGLPPKS